uniref:Homeobox protein cut-like n=1 Tax=Rhabditophanes sp. KR3021 TaxID=114890 RepID=A0AC35TIQ2_9BILA
MTTETNGSLHPSEPNYKEQWLLVKKQMAEKAKECEELERQLRDAKNQVSTLEIKQFQQATASTEQVKQILDELDRNAMLVDKLGTELGEKEDELKKERANADRLKRAKNISVCSQCSNLSKSKEVTPKKKEGPHKYEIMNGLASFLEKNSAHNCLMETGISSTSNDLFNNSALLNALALDSKDSHQSSSQEETDPILAGSGMDHTDIMKFFHAAVGGNAANINTAEGSPASSSKKLDPITVAAGLKDSATIHELKTRLVKNIAGLGTKALRTKLVADEAKRLMASYNIGQRLFAKVIMNQSQGTISELLSKPKYWNDLTDKGRDAFRRIFAWISDSDAIETLYSLSPRKIATGNPDEIYHPPGDELIDGDNLKTFPNNFMTMDLKSESGLATALKLFDAPSTIINTGKASTPTPGSAKGTLSDHNLETLLTLFNKDNGAVVKKESNPKQSDAHEPMSYQLNVGTIKLQDLPKMTFETLKFEGSLSTDCVCKEIRDFMHQNSCSQKNFAEMVLGVSAGSASDLISKPKSWFNLTNKGREPYIKMRIFLDLMKKIEPNYFKESKRNGQSNGTNNNNSEYSHRLSRQIVIPSTVRSTESPVSIKSEVSSVSENINTQELVENIKKVLTTAKVSTADFASKYMKLGRAIFEECLNRPGSWNHLNTQQKVPYQKMLAFFNDKTLLGNFLTNGIKALPVIEDTPSPYESENSTPLLSEIDKDGLLIESISQHLSGNTETRESLPTKRKTVPSSRMEDHSPPCKKRTPRFQRTIITQSQKETLLYTYAHVRHPSARLIDILAKQIDLNARTITNWFHNYRTRQKAKENQLAAEGINHAEQIKAEVLSSVNNEEEREKYMRLTEIINEDMEISSTCTPNASFPQGSFNSSIDNTNMSLSEAFSSLGDSKTDLDGESKGNAPRISALHNIIANLHTAKVSVSDSPSD